ncbi:MAG: GerAB/ArcD/ProY family transporter, partial [Oscillospiraceae bacterium]|nr:GerAB/ArcD/ProY family transporter [Oscillospiraceae bacterium]
MSTYKMLCVLALMMTGETLGLPAAPLAVLPLTLLTGAFAGSKAFSVLLIPCAAVTAGSAAVRFAPLAGLGGLEKTPLWVVVLVTAAVAAYLASGGAEGLSKWAAVSLPLTAGFLSLTGLLLAGKFRLAGFYIPQVRTENPAVLVCEAVTILGVIPALGGTNRPFRVYLSALTVAAGIGAACWAMANFTLGAELARKTAFPFFTALRVAKGGELIGRIETLLIPVSFGVTVMKIAGSLTVLRTAYGTLRPGSAPACFL